MIAVDLRGHGGSDAPQQRYTIAGLADDVAWVCGQLKVSSAVMVGHSLGGLVALELAATGLDMVKAAVMIDSALLGDQARKRTVAGLVADLRACDAERVLSDYFRLFFASEDDPAVCDWILDQAIRTPTHVSSSIWEESLRSWDDAEALANVRIPLLYIDAGTPDADLDRMASLNPSVVIQRTVGSGHFSQLFCPEQINALLDQFLTDYAPDQQRA